MTDGGGHSCGERLYCRDCGEMWCEHRMCSCFVCKCPCHGAEHVVHED